MACLFLTGVYLDLHRVMFRLSSKTGVLARVEGIETQANAAAKNLAQITATVKTGTEAWSKTTTAELDFVNGALPGLTGQLQTNLDFLGTTVTGHLQPAVDRLGEAAQKLGNTADAATGTANEVTATLNDHVDPLLDQATGSLGRLNDLMGSKDLNQALEHAYGVLGNVDLMTADGAHVTGLVRKRLDPWLDPPPCRGKHCVFIHTWNGIRYVLPLAQPAYSIDRMVLGSPY